MMRARGWIREGADVSTWTAQIACDGSPQEVLDLLTAPGAIARWSPVPFELVDFDHARLSAGDRVRVSGELAGRRAEFVVVVTDAGDDRLALTATGPIRLDVEYVVSPAGHGSRVRGRIGVSGGGLFGRLLARATDALLAGGALRVAMDRISAEVQRAALAT